MTYEPDESVVIHFLASDFLALMYSHSFFVTSVRHNLRQTYRTIQKKHVRLKHICGCAYQIDETRKVLKIIVLHHKFPATTTILTESIRRIVCKSSSKYHLIQMFHNILF